MPPDLVQMSEQLHSRIACLVDNLQAMTPDLMLHSRSHIIKSLALSTMYYVALSTMYYVALSTMYYVALSTMYYVALSTMCILASSHRHSHGFRSYEVQEQHGLCLAGTSC